MLGLGAGLVVAYLCALADRREGAAVQALTVGSVTALVVAGLLVVAFLDRPYEGQPGSVEPTEMRRTLAIIDREAPLRRPAPCDEDGTPRPA